MTRRVPGGGPAERPIRLRLGLLAAGVVVLDQLTKIAITRTLAVGESVTVVEGILRISHVRNTGAAFGILRGRSGLLALAAVVGIVVLVGVIVRHPPRMTGAGAALIAGGAMGNLLDRIVRDWPLNGSVVDFVDFRYWPAFNVADSAITAGAVLVVLAGFWERDEKDGEADTGSDEGLPDRGG